MNNRNNRAIRLFLLFSIALHAFIIFSFTDVFTANRHERRIEVDLREIKEEGSPKVPLRPKRIKQVTHNLDPIKEIVHQKVKYRQYPKSIVEPIKETRYRPTPLASMTNLFPKHYGGKVDPLLYYQRLIKQKIEENKRYPLFARDEGIEGLVWLKFVILRNGRLKDIKVVKSSPHQILDKAAIESIKKANPFPPFPEEIRERSLTMNICLCFELTHAR
ncbi:MAG: energy transducer TonB [Deltaproteobacteria bacterium]|nr:energy transducer TonB [Deltaproteobacteria bacterium]